MRAAVLRGGTVEARVIEDPVLGHGQLLVRSLACGICASDIHFMDHLDAGVDDDSGMSTYDPDVDIVMATSTAPRSSTTAPTPSGGSRSARG